MSGSSGGGGGGGGGGGDSDLEALLKEFPALARLDDGRVKCNLTGHVMHAKSDVIQPYVRGKKFAAALLKEKALDGLKEFEPHIVRSKYVPDKLFCRITGRYVQAKESAVVQHSSGKRFERGVESLTNGGGGKMLKERRPEEVEAERKQLEAEQKKAAEAHSDNKKKAAAAAASSEGKKAKKGRITEQAKGTKAAVDEEEEEEEE
eukprot:CAMPEP_0197584724 /NCGR_PEP_ID=MMETSP1326-20131121/7246_1 /TAXON_ID=1155430 /ORGANISM="Genus nov. species nov., Strain RCC2288" /LENGTH=204 /DNA_ID=CAMNT_0043149133 /DNA_START=147 /DNA_END=758 /DNA_ORIENTATION=-